MDKLYTIQEIASKLGLSDKTLRRWEDAGKFTPNRTLGNQRRYSVEDLQILDAIKHNVITTQSELLTADQAAQLCSVSPITITRWENEGKIHPFITAGHTYYPQSRLLAKLDTLKQQPISPQPTPPPPSTPQSSTPPQNPLPASSPLAPPTLVAPPHTPTSNYHYLAHALLTLAFIVAYHFFFNSPTPPHSPGSPSPSPGSVQGVTTSDPRFDLLEQKLLAHLAKEEAAAMPIHNLQLDNASYLVGTATLPQGQSQVELTHPMITQTTPITITFLGDYAPAKKYWVTASIGSFTLHTDFPVLADSPFHYALIIPTTLDPAPSATPATVLKDSSSLL